MPEFLLEIGCEEIPASWLAGLAEQLRARFREIAEQASLAPQDIVAFQTPRRLVVSAAVLARQQDREETVFGPSLKVARDAAGKWTKAAEGFARKCGTAADALEYGAKEPANPEDWYLRFVRKTSGREAAEVLPQAIAATLRSLQFPKRMSWDAWLDDGKGAFPFGRPIRWLVALLDGRVAPFRIFELVGGQQGPVAVESGDRTRGHRFLPRGQAGEPIAVTGLGDLKARLREACVLLDPAEREARLREQLAGHDFRGDDHGLLAEWRDLVEYPSVVAGSVPEEFQSLPREVLETVLVHHQKSIPLAAGGRVGRFAAVTNTDGSNAAEIVRGMERVIVARLRDGAFFYAEDRKRTLGSRVEDLAGVVFHQGLGTYQDKVERMERLVEAVSGLTPPERDAAREAARLSKADLTTLMVREFTELQGTMGGIYLEAEGGAALVAKVVRWHYHPVSIEEAAAPAGVFSGSDAKVFAAVSLADKLDTLAGYFGLGLDPRGSSDPYSLRRAALGVVRVLLDFWPSEPRPSLAAQIAAAVQEHAAILKSEPRVVSASLEAFLLNRLEYVLESRGFPADEVAAALYNTPTAEKTLADPHDALLRLRALHHVRSEAREDFEHLAVAFKRANNILDKTAEATLDPKLLREPSERALIEAVARAEGVHGSYQDRLRALTRLRAPVDQFFTDVLVMAEDPDLRRSRLGLLARARALFFVIADISKLGGQA